MRTSTKDSCNGCPALTEHEDQNTCTPYCIFYEGEVDPREDGCRHQFINKDEVLIKLAEAKTAKRR